MSTYSEFSSDLDTMATWNTTLTQARTLRMINESIVVSYQVNYENFHRSYNFQ